MTDDEILTDLETFNNAMIQFKEAVDTKDFDRMPNLFNQCLSLLKHIIETYRLMDSIDVLEYAAKLIHLLQDLHTSDKSKYNPEPFSQAVDQLALCLTARVTNRLVVPPAAIPSTDSIAQENPINDSNSNELLEILMKRSDGVDVAHEYAKQLSKYMFALIHYVQERSVEEIEHAERKTKLVNNCSLSTLCNTCPHLPALDLVSKALKNESKHQSKVQTAWLLLQTHEFVGKLDTWRTYHDNIRKTVKIQWDKCLKKFPVEENRTNSKSVVQLPTSSSSSSSTSSEPVTNPSMLSPHGSLQRTSSSPPTVHQANPTTNNCPSPNAQDSNIFQFESKRQEMQQTKHETLMILNKLIFNTENVLMDSLSTYFRLIDSLSYSSLAAMSRFHSDLVSSYVNYVHSLPSCSNQEDSSSIEQRSLKQIPIIIRVCCQAIEHLQGHKIKGIYRLSGVKSKVDHLCRQFVQGNDLNENDLVENYSAIVLANAIKKYLRELPVPLLLIVDSTSSGSTIQTELMNIGKEIYSSSVSNLSKINERLRQIIEQKLTDYAREALIHLLKHLHLISLSEQENQMSAGNLGIVFGPTLFKSQQRLQDDTTLSTLLEAPYQAKLIEYLILNVHDLFRSDV